VIQSIQQPHTEDLSALERAGWQVHRVGDTVYATRPVYRDRQYTPVFQGRSAEAQLLDHMTRRFLVVS